MANPYFRFKQFTIYHDKCAMKVGTDGVLLGAWVNPEKDHSILDIGTGSGLISLMLAQRTSAEIDAIDIDKDAYLQAQENISKAPFENLFQIYHSSLKSFVTQTKKKYDLIVSNPPYFIDSLKTPDEQRNLARHTDELSLYDLIIDSKKLLNSNGRIALILPFDQQSLLQKIIEENGLFIYRQTNVIPIQGGVPKRILIELSGHEISEPQIESLTIEINRHQYTPEFCTLTKDYYLKM